MAKEFFERTEDDWQLKAERWGIGAITVVVRMAWSGILVLIKFLRQAVYAFLESFKK